MSSKLKLTPKDCLYIDDALSQLCAIATRLDIECQNVSDKDVKNFINETTQGFSTHFDALKQMLKEASK